MTLNFFYVGASSFARHRLIKEETYFLIFSAFLFSCSRFKFLLIQNRILNHRERRKKLNYFISTSDSKNQLNTV